MIFKDWELELEGKHIRITPFCEEDEDEYGHLLLGDLYDELKSLGKKPVSGLQSIISHKEKDETHAIRPLDGNQLLGWIALQRNQDGEPDIGISLFEKYQNKGYGTEAIQIFGNYLYQKYELSELSIRTSTLNKQCQAALDKLGAIPVKEIIEPHHAQLLEENPTRFSDFESLMKLICYRIPLPIKEIQSRESSADPEEIAKAQEAYEAKQKGLTVAFRLDELDKIKALMAQKGVTTQEVNQLLSERIAQLQGKVGGSSSDHSSK